MKVLVFYEKTRAPNAGLVPMTATVLQSIFDEAQLLLTLPISLGRQTLYMLRHSGASDDGWMSACAAGGLLGCVDSGRALCLKAPGARSLH